MTSLAADKHRLGHGDGLALAAGQRRHRLADGAHGRDVEVGQHLARLDLHGGLVEEPVPQLLVPEEQVLDDVEVVAQREVLVDRRDPERFGVVRAVDVGRLALPEDLALRRLPQPGDGLDRHGLAGAVVADQRGDLACRNGEVDLVEGLDRPERPCSLPGVPGAVASSVMLLAPIATTARVSACFQRPTPAPSPGTGGRPGSYFVSMDITQTGVPVCPRLPGDARRRAVGRVRAGAELRCRDEVVLDRPWRSCSSWSPTSGCRSTEGR